MKTINSTFLEQQTLLRGSEDAQHCRWMNESPSIILFHISDLLSQGLLETILWWMEKHSTKMQWCTKEKKEFKLVFYVFMQSI